MSETSESRAYPATQPLFSGVASETDIPIPNVEAHGALGLSADPAVAEGASWSSVPGVAAGGSAHGQGTDRVPDADRLPESVRASRRELNEPRPRRGAPEQTRARLIRTAADMFNAVPYWETDTNQIAKAAGYSTGTFYRHFKDKREVFIAAYREWVVEEWASIESQVVPGLTPGESIDRAGDALIAYHRRWRVFRGNLRALLTYDEDLRTLTQALRRDSLEKMSRLRGFLSGEERYTLERDAIHAMMFERVCDAIADGEFGALGCSVETAQAEFRTLMRQYLLASV